MNTTIKVCAPVLHLAGQLATPLENSQSEGSCIYGYEGGLQAVATLDRPGGVEVWCWELHNTGSLPTRPVTRFCPLVLELPCEGRQGPTLHGSSGGLDGSLFPPTAWVQWQKAFVTEGLAWGSLAAASSGGRSSNRDLPFFVLEDAERSGGVFLGLGWSGDWFLFAERRGETVFFEAGMQHLDLVIEPGEKFSQPAVLLGHYAGDAASGQRALRRHLRDFQQPLLSGAPIPPFTFWNHYFGDRGCFTQDDALREMPLAASLGLEYFCIDGGWTGGGMDARFESLAPHIGNWRLCPEKFPGGWEPLKQCARQNNIKLGVWFDLERAHEDSLAYQEHPELFSREAAWDGLHLLRLDLPAGLEWAFETLSRVLNQSGAQWLRFDFNTNPDVFWEQTDSEGRRGSTEIRHLENLYRLWDRLRDSFPDLVIENCASGGRRIDLHTLRRTHTDWISDHTQSEAIVLFQLLGAARWLPFNHLGTSMAHAFLECHRPVDWTQPLPAAAYLSHFAGCFSVSDRLAPLTEAAREALRRAILVFKETAPCFAGDIYPLGRQEDALYGPCGLAATAPAGGRRAVLFFGTVDQARALVPPQFASMLQQEPVLGDEGSDQFTAAWLWADSL